MNLLIRLQIYIKFSHYSVFQKLSSFDLATLSRHGMRYRIVPVRLSVCHIAYCVKPAKLVVKIFWPFVAHHFDFVVSYHILRRNSEETVSVEGFKNTKEHTVFRTISSNRSRSLTSNTIGLMVLVIGPWCVASFVTYYNTCWYLIVASDVQKSEKLHFKLKIRSR